MKRLTLLTAVVSVMMLGASVSAHAEHNERGRRGDRNKGQQESHRAKTHKHSDGTYCSVDHNAGHQYQHVVEPSVCRMATEERAKLRRMRSRKIHLQQQYEYELNAFGWRYAKETYYTLQRVEHRLHSKRMQVRQLESQCEFAKQRQRRHYRYGWSDGYYRYRYSSYRN